MKYFKKILLEIKLHRLFLIFLVPIMVVIFYPVIYIDFNDLIWIDFEYILRYTPSSLPILSILKFYTLDQYGTIFAQYEIPKLFFGYSMTGYYLFNVVIRGLTATSIYLLVNWWCNKKIMAIVAGIFFAVSMSSIESTIWVQQYYSYTAVIFLCLNLYFWRRFHDQNSYRNLFFSALFFGLTLFVSHIRLPALPGIILIGEVYFFLKDKYQKKVNKLRWFHACVLILVFCVLFFTSNSLNFSQIFRRISSIILIKSLINGYPDVLHPYFHFISNLLVPSAVLAVFGDYLKISTYFDHPNIIRVFAASISLMFFLTNLIRKHFLVAVTSLWALAYASFFPIHSIDQSIVDRWTEVFSLSTLLGGTFFILLAITIFEVRKYSLKGAELCFFGCVIMLTSLIIPWISYPYPDSSIQAAQYAGHRYYTTPLIGISLMLGFLFSFAFELIKANWGFKIKNLALSLVLFSITLLIILNSIVTNKILWAQTPILDKTKNEKLWNLLKPWSQTLALDKVRDEKLWNLIKPYFVNLKDKEKDRVVYFDGVLNDQDSGIISLFHYRLALELGFTGRKANPKGNVESVVIINDKEKVGKLFQGDKKIYQELNLSERISEDNFLAFRVNKNGLDDITSEVIKEFGK